MKDWRQSAWPDRYWRVGGTYRHKRDAWNMWKWGSTAGYRWNYGKVLKIGFHDWEDDDARARSRPIIRPLSRDLLDRYEYVPTGFRFTGPFTRCCRCHGVPLDDEDELICGVTQKEVGTWDVVDSKGRVLVTVKHSKMIPTDILDWPEEEEVCFLW